MSNKPELCQGKVSQEPRLVVSCLCGYVQRPLLCCWVPSALQEAASAWGLLHPREERWRGQWTQGSHRNSEPRTVEACVPTGEFFSYNCSGHFFTWLRQNTLGLKVNKASFNREIPKQKLKLTLNVKQNHRK